MSSSFRVASKTSRILSRAVRRPSAPRSLHTPFAVLGNSPIMSPPAPVTYEKQCDFSSEPLTGTRTYVVSEPDTTSKYYEVPSGAYPTSSPYINFTATEAPNTHGAQVSSTSSTLLAHEQTIRTVPHHWGGVGESSAVRHALAPGEMGERGGSHGGLDLMDAKGTVPPEISPTDRNPPPDGGDAEMFSMKGITDAWKQRK
ncbi:hypothetical protein Hypma_006816 [Hypsizygus marmoreus]|uniref:Uncharacterized protein n=1 Tax=Hypsizygus marmoreus TaxID=39966 RepID=A0A369K4R5_HYPMA|nr:hypothetical protein Hypma_006816 [Hypsizygus marmoreus]